MARLPSASLGRELQSPLTMPTIIHSLHQSKSSVLSLAANDDFIFSGNQNHDISVWDKVSFHLHTTLQGHTGSVLALEYAADREWLFSSSGDSTVRVWCTKTLQPVYVIHPYMENCAGDIFSLAWSPELQTIYIGCQNTSVQWFNFSGTDASPPSPEPIPLAASDSVSSGISTPTLVGSRRAHKFFDSYPMYERRAADVFANNPGRASPSARPLSPQARAYLSISAENNIDTAHYGYVYCMAVLSEREQGPELATGSGDETVKLWSCTSRKPELIYQFSLSHGAVLVLASRGDTLYAGCQDGYVKVLDLETKTIVRTIIVEENIDILTMSMFQSDLYTCSANGTIKRWSAAFDCTASWQGHDGIILSSIISKKNGHEDSGFCLLTGANEGCLKVWEVKPPSQVPSLDRPSDSVRNRSCIGSGSVQDTLVFALSRFVAIPSVSCESSHREDCRQAAIWLRKCLGQLGAQTNLISTGEGLNPLVLATFTGSVCEKPRPRILFYGHYDVISAPQKGWDSNPFVMSGRNGYLYGRGVTDDKGPIIATACAAADLLTKRALGADLVFLIEGEEECGSTGFRNAVQANKDAIGHIDAILVRQVNSTWITDDRPSITYGLRGVIHCNVELSNDRPSLHSGIEGGAVDEPMVDMVRLLASIIDNKGVVQIPGFYEQVRPVTEDETKSYNLLAEVTGKPASLLASRWREPSLTIHSVEISGPRNSTVIPGKVNAQISLRIVPDQDLETIVKSLQDYLESSFKQLNSPNTLKVHVDHTADWWLGDLDDHWSKSLEGAIEAEWGRPPLRIREGGSIPSVPYLEKEFKCRALHLPMGQSSDQAHLPNERISLVNLYKGKEVVERFLTSIVHP